MVQTISDFNSLKKCRYYNGGYCKFLKTNCHYFHPEEQCEVISCDQKDCSKRHPKICKYHNKQSKCRFKDKCLYRHDLHKNQSKTVEDNSKHEIERLNHIINQKNMEFQNVLESKNAEIEKLQTDISVKVKVIEDIKETKKKDDREKERVVKEFNLEIVKRNETIADLKNKLVSSDTVIKELNCKVLKKQAEWTEKENNMKQNNEKEKETIKNEIISKFKNEVSDYQKMSENRRKEMYFVNKSIQETLIKKEEEITELQNK